jgi:acetyl-CoA decarbonylase/synthase complex subunit beta
VDPKGPVFEIQKGEVIDEFTGEFEGVNRVVKEKTLGEHSRVQLYTAFNYPHTSCGCFEGVAFYIPEVDGIGIIHRDFRGPAVNGLTFSAMADSTAGGRQIDGFHGISIEYMRSPKFLQVDGGWSRVVWVPSAVKERVKDFIPAELVDKIPTEKDVKDLEGLRAFLEAHDHPVVERMRALEVAPPIPAEAEPSVAPEEGGEFVLVLKDARIYAKRAVIKRIGSGSASS